MTRDEFSSVVKSTFAKCRKVMDAKAEVYAAGDDRLGNFKDAAMLQGFKQTDAIMGMMAKHIVAIGDMLALENDNEMEFSLEEWDERIIDNINYLLFLRAAIIERSE